MSLQYNTYMASGWKHHTSIIMLVVSAALLAACRKQPPTVTGDLPQIVKVLMERRLAFSTIEGDVKFNFPSDKVFSPAFEGHAAYELGERGGRARVIATGPLGVMPMDFLIVEGKYSILLADLPEPLDSKAIVKQFGKGPLYWVAETLSERIGLFFGGIPESMPDDFSIEREGESTRIASLKDGVTYYIEGNPAVITRAVISKDGISDITMSFGGFEDTPYGPIATEVSVFFENEPVFQFSLKRYEIGRSVPEGIFKRGE